MATGEYTIFRNENGRLEFQERINSSSWKGPASSLRYRAGYIPDAIRVGIRVLNDDGEEPRNLSVVVNPFRKI